MKIKNENYTVTFYEDSFVKYKRDDLNKNIEVTMKYDITSQYDKDFYFSRIGMHLDEVEKIINKYED